MEVERTLHGNTNSSKWTLNVLLMGTITKLNGVSGHEISGHLWPLALTKDPASTGLKNQSISLQGFPLPTFYSGLHMFTFRWTNLLLFYPIKNKNKYPGSVLQLLGHEGHPPSCGHMQHGGQTHSLHASQERRAFLGPEIISLTRGPVDFTLGKTAAQRIHRPFLTFINHRANLFEHGSADSTRMLW